MVKRRMPGGKLKPGKIIGGDSTGQDGIFLKNQLIATEGVLPYEDGWKLKKWEDLKRNIGRKIPVIDEHPSPNNGMFGVFHEEPPIGWATIKQYKNEHALAADVELLDDAPVRKGWSAGYLYFGIPEEGEFDGIPYQEVQRAITLDHLAFCRRPRNHRATLSAGDAISSIKDRIINFTELPESAQDDGTPGVFKYSLGYDSIDDIRRDIMIKLISMNPDTSHDVLWKFAEQILENMDIPDGDDDLETIIDSAIDGFISGQPVENLPADINTKDDADMSEKEIEKLRSELDTLKSENISLKNKIENDSQIDEISSKLEAEKEAKAELQKQLDAMKEKEMLGIIKTVCEATGLDSEHFNGKSYDYITGFNEAWEKISHGPDEGKKVDVETDDDGVFIVEFSEFDSTWDHERNQFIDPMGNPYTPGKVYKLTKEQLERVNAGLPVK